MKMNFHKLYNSCGTVFKREITSQLTCFSRSSHDISKIVSRTTFHVKFFSSSRWPAVNINNSKLLTYMTSIHENCLLKKRQLEDSGLHKNQKKHSQLQMLNTLIRVIEEMWNLKDQVKQLEHLVSELKEESEDVEMLKLADEDLRNIHQKQEHLKNDLLDQLLPEETEDKMGIMMELSAGVGGQEAMLFTKDMFKMYYNYAQFKNWQIQVLDYAESDIGGVRHACLGMSGDGVGRSMKFESGVHRVQRVPRTEKSGRIHTSTMTVAVLPQPSEIEVVLNAKDLLIETKRAAGPGGQNVNKVESAVRITHIPTGILVECQMERSQQKNRQLAMAMLRAKVYDMRQTEQTSRLTADRRMQVGSGARSEKARTYNFPQDRVSDHRFNINFYNMEEFLNGGQHFDSVIQTLIDNYNHTRLEQLLDNKTG